MTKKLLTLISMLALSLIASPIFAQSSLTLPVDNFDFGYVPQNASISHKFWIFSNGKDTLIISSVKTSCGCTQAPLEKRILAPGDSTMLEIIFSTGRFSSKVSKTATITANTGKPEDRVTITSNIFTRPDSTYPVIIRPNGLDLSRLSDNNHRVLKFSIENLSSTDIVPSMIAFPQEFFEVKLPNKIKAGKTAEGTLKLRQENLSATFQKSFTIEWNDKDRTRFTIPVVKNNQIISSSQSSN